MLAIIFTLIMFAALVVGLIKGWHAASWVFLVTIVFAFIWVAITGNPIMAETVSGNKFVDIFELITTAAVSQFSFCIFIIGVVMGFVAYIDSMKASAVFANVCAKPLLKMKSPYVICAIGLLVAAIFKFIIPAPGSVVALLLATVYPIMRSAGVSKQSSASALAMGVAVPWGPANSFIYAAFQPAGLDTAFISEWAITYQTPMCLVILLFMMVALFFISKFFDKREGVLGANDEGAGIIDTTGVPKIYGILPLLPLIFIILFTFVFKIKMGLVAATFISLIIAIIVRIVTSKEKIGFKGYLKETQPVFTEAGKFLGNVGFLLIACSMFATVIQKVGGLQILVDAAVAANMSAGLLLLIALVIVVAMVAMTGATIGMLPLFAPIFMMIATATGIDPYGIINVLLIAASLSGTMSLIYASNVIVSDSTGTKLTALCKRDIVPVLVGVAISYVYTMIVFA